MGAIIAGGRASRFGSDKALAQWRGRPLIAHARDALAPWCDALVVCGREWDGMTSLPDQPAAGLGPLGGIAAALEYARGNGFASVLTIGCDMPAVPAELLATLAATFPSFCPDAPILGHWPAQALERLLAVLTHAPAVPVARGGSRDRSRAKLSPGQYGGGRSVRAWASALDAIPVPAPVPLHNINTPADLPA